MVKKCVRDALYLNYQSAFCRYMGATYDMMEATLPYMLQQSKLKKKKCAVVLDIDGTTHHSEDVCAEREIWSKAVDFIKSTKKLYKRKLTFFLITARPSDYGVVEDFADHGIEIGKNKDIEHVYYDDQNLGTEESKIRNRQSVRNLGYTIIASCGDNLFDLVPESETHWRSQTANFLLPNIYRHEYT